MLTGLQENNDAFQECWLWVNEQLVKNNKLLEIQNLRLIANDFKKAKVSPDNSFLFETLHIKLRRHICLTLAVILSSTNNFFTTIASLCNNVTTSSKKNVTSVYVFLLCHYHLITPTDHSENTGFFQRVQKVMSEKPMETF